VASQVRQVGFLQFLERVSLLELHRLDKSAAERRAN
jgi:hypothetical protein